MINPRQFLIDEYNAGRLWRKNTNESLRTIKVSGLSGFASGYLKAREILKKAGEPAELATKYHTIKSRYAKKYFGLLKGVVLYSLNANHLPLCLKVIGANQHESHFLLDIVESNTSDVEITAVSGDMHSINRVNFALMYLFGYRFMPRFTQLCEKSDQHLVCFDELENHAKHIIKPSKRVNKALIIKEWDKVLRILASLALKKTTQSQIVSKLSTYKKTNPTLKALIAFDEIIMTDYLLDYIDSKEIRAVVQGSLNRGESYHQLSSTIAKVSGGRMLSGKTVANSILIPNLSASLPMQ